MSIVEPRITKLYLALGHSFNRPELLVEALTHPSFTSGEGDGKRNYERLEFLGDRVLGLAVSGMVLDRYQVEKVGSIARRHTALVRAEALTRVATRIDLGSYLRLSKGEEDAGGRENPQILADCCEAVIGALYLDGGLDAAVAFIATHWGPMMNEAVRPPRDAKTALQEWAQGSALPLPEYTLVEQTGPAHEPQFTIQVHLRGFPRATATGRTKREAEQAAAALLLRIVNTHAQAAQRSGGRRRKGGHAA